MSFHHYVVPVILKYAYGGLWVSVSVCGLCEWLSIYVSVYEYMLICVGLNEYMWVYVGICGCDSVLL